MHAVVLVGGEGTRLRPLTESTPKPVVELVDRPFLSHMIEWLESHGVTGVTLACGFMPDAIETALGEFSPAGTPITCIAEPEPLGTGGAIRFAAEGIEEAFIALNGDCLSDLDLGFLLRSHRESGARATLGLYPVEDPAAFGLVLRDSAGWVTEFLEKPQPGTPEAERAGQVAEPEINAGMYVLEPEVLDLIPSGSKVSIERHVFPRLVGAGLRGERLEGYWQDIGTPERYLSATWDILEGRISTSTEVLPGAVFIDESAKIDGRGSEAAPDIGPRAVIGPGAHIGAGARIERSVVHGGCDVGAGASVIDSILAPGAVAYPGDRVESVVLGGAGTGDMREIDSYA